MPNAYGAYNMAFYAQRGLMVLENKLGMARRVYRGYDEERRTRNDGQTVTIRRPAKFVAQNPITASQDVKTEYVTINLVEIPGVQFEVTDIDYAYVGERFIAEHIERAVHAVAEAVDNLILAKYKDIPWLYDYGTATDHTIITGAKAVAFANKMPDLEGDGTRVHLACDGTLQMYFENSNVFNNAQYTGDGRNPTLFRGGLGVRFGVEAFALQTVGTQTLHVPGTANQTAGDSVGAVNSNPLAAGATVMAVDGLTGAETIKAGDTFVIAGNTQRYAVTADVTLVSGAAAAMNFTPAAVQQYADGAVLTFTKQADAGSVQNMLFHEEAFAVVTAPLPSYLPGIEASVATNDETGLSIRARRWATGLPAKTYVAFDILCGVQTLDPNLAVRIYT